MVVYDELRCMKKLEKYIKFVEEGNCEAMRKYGGKEIIDLSRNNHDYFIKILERLVTACFNKNWQIRVSAVAIYQSLLEIFLNEQICIQVAEEISNKHSTNLDDFDYLAVITNGSPLLAQNDEEDSVSTTSNNNKKISAKRIIYNLFVQSLDTNLRNLESTDENIIYLTSHYKFLLDGIVSSIWTERHSSVLCLEAFIRVLYSKLESSKYSTLLMEIGYCCMVVLLLDKYGDYVSCNVVAPVIESVSQLLGLIVYLMEPNDINKIISIILTTLKDNQYFEHGWQLVHGCLVASKYILLACQKRQFPLNSQLVENVHQFFIKSFGGSDENSINNDGMIMDDVLAETCVILMMVSDYKWPFIEFSQIITFIIDNMEMLDESCSSLSRVIDLLIHYSECLIESLKNNNNVASNCDFLYKNSIKILKFLYSYALIRSKEMESLIMAGSTKIICYYLNNVSKKDTNCCRSLFWGHIYYLNYVLLTSETIDDCLELLSECVENLINCINVNLQQIVMECDPFISVLLNLITSPIKSSITHDDIIRLCSFPSSSLMDSIFSNSYERPNYVGSLDGPVTIYQINMFVHQRVICLEMIVKIISRFIQVFNNDTSLTFTNTLINVISNYHLNASDSNFPTKSLIFSTFLYSLTTIENFNEWEIFESVDKKIQFIIDSYLPTNGVQDVFFTFNLTEIKYLLNDTNQDIIKFVHQSKLELLPVKNSKTLRQAISFFNSLCSSTVAKETVVTIINKLNQIELAKYVYCSRVQLYLILFVISIRQRSDCTFLNTPLKAPSWYIIPLMEAVKYEDIKKVYQCTCKALVSFIRDSENSPLEKIFNNVAIYITTSCLNYFPLSLINQSKFTLHIQTEHLDTDTIKIDTNNGLFAIYYYHHCVDIKDKTTIDDGQDICPISNQIECVVVSKETNLKNSVELANNLLMNSFCHCSNVVDKEKSILNFGGCETIIMENCINKLVFDTINNWNLNKNDKVNLIINSLLLFEHFYETLYKSFPAKSVDLLERICEELLGDQLTSVRTVASSVLARILTRCEPIFAIHFIHMRVLNDTFISPHNGNDSGNDSCDHVNVLLRKCGLAEFIFYVVNLVNDNNINLLAMSFIVHVVRNLMDENYQVSYCYSIVLSQLMKYIPLFVEKCTNFVDCNDDRMDVASDLSTQLPIVKKILLDQLNFMRELSMPSSNKPLELPFDMTSVTLRPYQSDGINWLLFLQKYNLNGALCDDMGLGKTLQTIVTIAYTQCNNKLNKSNHKSVGSLIVCPPILIQHWLEEFLKFLPSNLLNIVKFDDVKQFKTIFKSLKSSKIDILITSYAFVRNHIDKFRKFAFNYLALDEAHLIKNKNSKYFLAIKTIRSKYRLILTGTPIQNNVTELWTLFDFLMPNFLGSHKMFSRVYARPILKGFNPKCTTETFLQGQKLLLNLHKQILPFVLRRTKHTVLDDLPEKIIQTIYCALTPLQKLLYEVLPFDKEARNNVLSSQLVDISLDESQSQNTHVFKMIHYLRRVCNHPSLALGSIDDTNVNDKIKTLIEHEKHSLNDISVASKLVALMELLQDCGIYSDESKNSDEDLNMMDGTDAPGHRALIFTQTTAMLDIIENDLLKKHMPDVRYLRLDGSVRQSNRFPITKQFNNDSDISLLLLTTSVGSLGLNLTGADMVIFYDNDWNPMKDLQAMDRAHRIGQTKTVNVYRLVIKDTIEEHILNLQNYKLKMVNTVINESNSDLNKMKDSDITDVFGADTSAIANYKDESANDEEINENSLKRSHSKLNSSNHADFTNGDDYAKHYDLKKFCKNLK